MRAIKMLLICVLFCDVGSAVLEHQFVTYGSPVKRLLGIVIDYTGTPIPQAEVEVYDHPEVWDDDSLNLGQKRAVQRKVGSCISDDKGKFNIRAVPDGRYEVQFSRMGWNILSAFVTVDHHSRADNLLCVELQISSGPDTGRSRIANKGWQMRVSTL